MARYVFVTGGVVSSLGKGLSSASLAALLQLRGFKVRIRKQLRQSLKKNFSANKIIIAYEPVWSIGTNKIPKINELKNIIRFIKNDYRRILKTNKSPKVLYGGSVNDKNIRLFSPVSEIDGFLIGGASQSSKKFIDIVKNYYK